MITSPSTSSPFANSEPRIDVRATTISPAESANSTMKSSGRLPSVDCSAPVTAGPYRSPTDSVAIEIAHASPPSATAAIDEDDDRLGVREVEDAGEHGERPDGREDDGRPAHRRHSGCSRPAPSRLGVDQ